MNKRLGKWRNVIAFICVIVVCMSFSPVTVVYATTADNLTESISLSDQTTDQLIETLVSDRNFVTAPSYCNSFEAYEWFVQTMPCVQELLSRTDGVAALERYIVEGSPLSAAQKDALSALLQVSFVQSTITPESTNFATTYNSDSNEFGLLSTYSDYPNSFTGANDVIYYRASTNAYTNGKQLVPLYSADRTLTLSQKNTMLQDMELDFPDVVIRSNPDASYNCHSYAWYQSSSSNKYWISHAGIYANDKHTVETEPETGSIAIYLRSDGYILHSGIVTSTAQASSRNYVWIKSKWGQSVLCEHLSTDVPLAYSVDGTSRNFNIVYFKITEHTYRVTSKNEQTHTLTCSVCNYSYSQSHTANSLGVCTVCSYSGPISQILGCCSQDHSHE